MNRLDYAAIGETLYTRTLPNGLPVFVLRKKGLRKSFAAFAARYGGADRRFRLDGRMHDTPAGIAHYLEHKMFDMPDGSAMGLSTARYFTGGGKSLIGTGLTPDPQVSLTQAQQRDLLMGKLAHEDDAQLQAAIQTLRQ